MTFGKSLTRIINNKKKEVNMASGSSGKKGGRGSKIKNSTRARQRVRDIFNAAANAGAPF